MSLAVDTDTVTDVLLADGWHSVADNSFDIDSYEFLWSGVHGVTVAATDFDPEHTPLVVHGGGASGICPAGFAFRNDDGQRIVGPLSSVLAVRCDP